MNNAPTTRRTARSPLSKLQLLLFLALAAAVLFGPQNSAAMDLCVSTLVANEVELDKAIAVFNAEVNPRCHRITLVDDIPLTEPTRTISNFHGLTGAYLIINGAGFSVQGAEDIRPFTIAAHTNVIMNKITITGGDVDDDGGGIYNAGNLKLNRSTISGNQSEWTDGGGIYNTGKLKVASSSISDNYAGNDGGGIFNRGTLSVTGSKVSYNGGEYGFGGGISNHDGTLKIAGSDISHNYSENCGGVSNKDGTITVADSTISHNWSEFHGAVYNDGTATLAYCTVADNGTGDWGGGISNHRGTMTITNSTLSGNDASMGGGGIENEGKLILTNSTVSGNTASEIAGGINNSGKLILTNSTVSGNEVDAVDGVIGGIANSSKLVLHNSIIANSVNGDCMNRGAGAANALSSLIEDKGDRACNQLGGKNGNIIGIDPRLGRLSHNGGPTLTHALLWRSPAIDTGDNVLAVNPSGRTLKTDQRGKGYPRILNKIVDMGAFEGNTILSP